MTAEEQGDCQTRRRRETADRSVLCERAPCRAP
jgi:hypothetical protein